MQRQAVTAAHTGPSLWSAYEGPHEACNCCTSFKYIVETMPAGGATPLNGYGQLPAACKLLYEKVAAMPEGDVTQGFLSVGRVQELDWLKPPASCLMSKGQSWCQCHACRRCCATDWLQLPGCSLQLLYKCCHCADCRRC